MKRSLQLTLLLVLACLFTLGCQTYVNIPRQGADTANHNPNGKTVRKVMIHAIRTALLDGGIVEPVQLMLPEETSMLTYTFIANEIGDQVVLADDEAIATVRGVVFAKGVRIRGNSGEVDIVRPVGDGIDQLVTVYLTWKPVNGWYADSVRVWRGVPIED
jgi:hypothetical protein